MVGTSCLSHSLRKVFRRLVSSRLCTRIANRALMQNGGGFISIPNGPSSRSSGGFYRRRMVISWPIRNGAPVVLS